MAQLKLIWQWIKSFFVRDKRTENEKIKDKILRLLEEGKDVQITDELIEDTFIKEGFNNFCNKYGLGQERGFYSTTIFKKEMFNS